MRFTTELSTVVCVVFALQGCSDGATATDAGTSESGDGEGDPGDGDGEPGDGDGDDACACTEEGPFDACRAGALLPIISNLSWDIESGELDETCTVTAVARGAFIELDCPSGPVNLDLAVLGDAPEWVPGFTAGESLRLRANDNGVHDWHQLGWRLDSVDTGASLVGALRAETLDWLASPLSITVETGLCKPTCGEGKTEPLALHLKARDAGVDELVLFTGETGLLGEHRVHLGRAEQTTCVSPTPGEVSSASYSLAWIHEPTATNACALVLDRVYTSDEQLECGLSPDGVVLCNWSVGFDGEQFVWNYSDVGEAGGYDCVGLELVARPGGELLGTVSADGSSLIWSGVGYSRVDP